MTAKRKYGIADVKLWLARIVRYGYAKYVEEELPEGKRLGRKGERHAGFRLYTTEHCYRIYAVERPGPDYLGCTVSNRKCEARETWHRGSDLPDGKLNPATWNRIVCAIIGEELVGLSIHRNCSGPNAKPCKEHRKIARLIRRGMKGQSKGGITPIVKPNKVRVMAEKRGRGSLKARPVGKPRASDVACMPPVTK